MRGKPLPVVHRKFYDPSPECLERLARPWIASYSGGKDSTSLVTWLEYLRRTGQIKADKPRLVLSDTGVEYPFLIALAREMMDKLRKRGWECDEVRPPLKDRLYVQIFGKGLPPVHLGVRRMRWCTASTKVFPMDDFRDGLDKGILTLTGMRWGESDGRDAKLRKGGCSAGGECGTQLSDRGENYAPIINWTTCNVADWLSGAVSEQVDKTIPDLLKTCGRLVGVYKVRKKHVGFGIVPPEVEALRFGCIGCPAVGAATGVKNFTGDQKWTKFLNYVYGLWEELRRRHNLVHKIDRFGRYKFGPIKLSVRKKSFEEFLVRQREAGVVVVTAEDEALIRDCWERKVYPRGWSEADELNEVKEPGGLL